MADLDTRNKRASAIGFARSPRVIFENPDGGLGQADRQQAAYSYPGILAAAAAAIIVFEDLTTVFVSYLASLAAAHNGGDDPGTQLRDHLATVIGATNNIDDLNTMYCEYCSPRF